ncbi:hypothetical protein LSUE1_G002147 [Lachnellula suecica]|uniref:Uncharacterized protein n=1 Tax=Lachnellula suecica TaxID=602035 RepID=A0A8T9CCV5_9HELO|nr:hypothetical protein LSUE1_G002147 [Lachnellula suecica]
MYLTVPSILVTTLLSHYTFAFPTTSLTPRNTPSLHACSVYVQRWTQTPLTAAPTSDWTWNYPYQTNFWNQESSDVESSSAGSQLVPWQVGSNILYITNTANPVEDAAHDDPGKLSFSWGSQSWDSFSSGSPCLVQAVGADWSIGGATQYECTFECDVDVGN